MSDALHFTARDRAIVQALVQKVRLFSQRQRSIKVSGDP